MSISSNVTNSLTTDVLIEVFCFLKQHDLASCSQVSKYWNASASDNKVWTPISEQMYGAPLRGANIKALLQEIASQHLTTNEEIMDRLQTFLNKVSLGQTARFRCLIGIGAQYTTISVEIKATQDTIPSGRGARRHHLNKFNLIDNSKFNFTYDCVAIQGVGNGSLVTSHPPGYTKSTSSPHEQLRGMKECISACDEGPFMVAVRFPDLKREDPLKNRTDMERRITHMSNVKLNELSSQASQASRKQAVIYTIALGIFAVSAYSLNLYLTAVNPDQ